VSDYCLTSSEECSAISWKEQAIEQALMKWWCLHCNRPTRSICRICDNTRSLKQQSTVRHVAPLQHIILTSSQHVFNIVLLLLKLHT